jgi:hypothetical protein
MREMMKQVLLGLALAAAVLVARGLYQSNQTKVLHERAMQELLKDVPRKGTP